MEESQNSINPAQGSTVIVNQTEGRPSNGIGVAGFVLALLALFLGWIPFLGWLLWVLGLVFSAIGISKTPKGLAIAGLIISLLGLILLIMFFGALGAAISLS